MADLWGYRIALKTNEKCLKSCVRSSLHGCFVYDCSYYEVVEISPLTLDLIPSLSSLLEPDSTSRIIDYLQDGARRPAAWSASVYTGRETYLGPAMFLLSSTRCVPALRIIVHPLITNDILPALPSGLVTARRGEFSLFDLEGAGSLAALKAILVTESPQWNSVQLTSTGADHAIWDFSAQDPRFQFPPSLPLPPPPAAAIASAPPSIDSAGLETVGDVAGSGIWDHGYCEELLARRKSQKQLDEIRSACALPGSKLLPQDADPCMPVVVVAQGEHTETGRLRHRWRVMVPAGWGQFLWRSLIYLPGVRFGGLAEWRKVALEHGRPVFPDDYPTATAFPMHIASKAQDLEAEWRRKPPAKRPNYAKIGVDSPFAPPFDRLLATERTPAGQEALPRRLVQCRVQLEQKGVPRYNSSVYDRTGALLGYVTSGDYSVVRGTGAGIASCVLPNNAEYPMQAEVRSLAGVVRPAVLYKLE